MTVHRRPSHAVALRPRLLVRLQRDLHLGHRLPRIAELCLVEPAQVPHEGDLHVGAPHVPHVYLHVRLVLGQGLYDQRVASSLPDQSAKSPPEDPVLVGLVHHLPVYDPDGHDEEDGHPETGNSSFPGFVHLLQSRVPCYLRDGARVPISSVGHVVFIFYFFFSAKNHTEREKKAAEIFARQRSPLLHHVIMFAVVLTEQTKPTLSIHAVYSDDFFVLRNCASNGDLSCEESCERKKGEAKAAKNK